MLLIALLLRYNIAILHLLIYVTLLTDYVTSHMLAIRRSNIRFGTRGGALGGGTVLLAGWEPVRFPLVSLKFFIDIILPAALRPWGRLSL